MVPAGVLAAFVAVLVVIGGGVTTYRVGMAVPDWPATFQQNMWTYPFSDMLAEGHGVTLEHAHRVWASGVGLVAICVLSPATSSVQLAVSRRWHGSCSSRSSPRGSSGGRGFWRTAKTSLSSMAPSPSSSWR